MHFPSFTLILSGVFLGYIAYSIYTISQLFSIPPCKSHKTCIESYLSQRPKLQIDFFTSIVMHPSNSEAHKVYTNPDFDYTKEMNIPLTLNIPYKTRQNGTMYLHILSYPPHHHQKLFNDLKKEFVTVHTVIKLTAFREPAAETFNLLGKEENNQMKIKGKKISGVPITHLKSKVTFTIMTDDVKIPVKHIPLELSRIIKINPRNQYLPVLTSNFLYTRRKDLVKVTPNSHTMNITVTYNPISLGKLRLILHIEAAMQDFKKIGFTEKDIDDVKGIFADTNLYLLATTIFISGMHLLFDFLAFKNDISFWKNKNDLGGLSMQTVLWRAFSQAVIFLYLLDEGSSLLVLVPAGIGAIIEFWKTKKILRAEISWARGVIPQITFNWNKCTSAETKTREIDAESMRYISYLLYPLVILGAIYSLLYLPHKSWYSWCVQSMVNGVYAFGFLFMLPQLFVNYRLKSVAHLPWRSFMYKAFNTFIDDVFAFIITMPMAHRVACFRDDAVFLVYLYQRWLYPVDKSRMDSSVISEDPVALENASQKKEK